MLNNNVSFAQAYVNERVSVLSEHIELPKPSRSPSKPRRFWQRFLSLWL